MQPWLRDASHTKTEGQRDINKLDPDINKGVAWPHPYYDAFPPLLQLLILVTYWRVPQSTLQEIPPSGSHWSLENDNRRWPSGPAAVMPR